MITKTKIICANLIVLLACLYLAYESKHYGYCLFIYICVAFTLNGVFISEKLNEE